jgi:hypothetical protein
MPLYCLPVFLGPPRHNLYGPQRAPSRWGHFFVRRTNEGTRPAGPLRLASLKLLVATAKAGTHNHGCE